MPRFVVRIDSPWERFPQPTPGRAFPARIGDPSITAPGQLGRHPAEHEILPVDDQDEGRAPLDRRQVREGEVGP